MKLLRRIAVLLVLLAAAGVYGSVGLFEVAPDEQAVVLRLGRYHDTLGPGLQWHAKWLDQLHVQRVTATLAEEFGYRTMSPGPPVEYQDQPEEKRMLSGDANVVNVEFVVQYRIADLRQWLFSVAEPEKVVRDAAQAVMRDVIAQRPIDEVLTSKGPIEQEAEVLLQQVLDSYRAGMTVQNVRLQDVEPPAEVKESFADVASAEQDRARLVLEAQGYADEVVPRARGEAQALVNEAQGYNQSRVLRAEGESERFLALLAEYQKAPRVTRERLSLETLEQILPGIEKIVIEEGQTEKMVPYLPLGRRGRAE